MSSAWFHNSSNSEISSKFHVAKWCDLHFKNGTNPGVKLLVWQGQLLSYHAVLCTVVKYFVREYRGHIWGIYTYNKLFMTIFLETLTSESSTKMRGITANDLDLFFTIFILKSQFSFGIQSVFVWFWATRTTVLLWVRAQCHCSQ